VLRKFVPHSGTDHSPSLILIKKAMSIFTHFKGVQLSADQHQALTALEAFLEDADAPIFVLQGYAGTGKTFLMQGVARWLQALERSVLFTAPTGRAAKVLQHSSGQMAQTIHRAIYALEAGSQEGAAAFKLADREADPNAHWVFVVDEASMLGDVPGEEEALQFGSGRLLRDYIQYANFAQFPRTKIIFVGDSAQLPPVNMDFSPALSVEYLLKTYRMRVVSATLRTVVRQKNDSDLLRGATQLRTMLEAGPPLSARLPLKSGDGIRVVPAPALLQKYLELSGAKPSPQQVIIVHSNVEVIAYNRLVRKHYFPESPQQPCPGDVLVLGHNAYHLTPALHNGEIVRVESVGTTEVRTLTAPRGKIRKTPTPYLTFSETEIKGGFRFLNAVVSVRTASGTTVRLEVKLLADWLEDESSALPFAAQYLLRRDAQDRFYQANRRLYATNKPLFERERAVFCATDPYLNALRCRYGYAITCHKAQGGEWKYVFVDLRAKMQRDSPAFYRWVYTSITRAKRCVWLAFTDGNKDAPVSKHNRRVPVMRPIT
jgi:tRNA A37 threonylcarbamoyladenosine biosynthesis protein TsaE